MARATKTKSASSSRRAPAKRTPKKAAAASRGILDKTGLKPKDFKYAVFHMPNGKFPLSAGKTLGFTMQQMETGWLVPQMGNTYSGSSPTGLAAVLDVAAADDLILITSFGSGAASDSFVLKATKLLTERRGLAPTVRAYLAAIAGAART